MRITITSAIISGLFYTLMTTATFAATINMHEKPSADSKVVASVASDTPLKSIFYTEQKDWVKVGNPQNGEVGWIKAAEFKETPGIIKINSSQIQHFFTHQDNKKEPATYSIIQYSGPNELKPEDAKKAIQEMEKRNEQMKACVQKMQAEMQKSIQEAFKVFDNVIPALPLIQVIPDNKNTNKK